MDGKKEKTRILIVDDHPIVREGISQLINAESDLEVCCGVDDKPGAMTALAEKSPDMVIVDLSLKDSDGLDLIEHIRARYPDLAILTLSMYDETLYAERALRAGSNGYVMKQAGTETLVHAIRRVLGGRVYLSEEMASQMLGRMASGTRPESSSPVEKLSNRELEVFTLIGKGVATGKIAEKLNLSVKTIETYRNNIKNKLNIDDSAQLVQRATLFVHSLKQK
jgi:DNA-binding NarL/FixJ family response regulator